MIPSRHPMARLIARKGGLIIDGAMSTALEAKGLDLNDRLWSARALIERPELVREVHLDYFKAGADAAITCSYQASEAGFADRGLSRAESERLIRLSAELAREAIQEMLSFDPEHCRDDYLVAGAVGPYGAYLANGSEYTGGYALTRAEYEKFHELRIQALLSGGADILAVETQPRLDEIEAILGLIDDRDVTCWVTVTLRDGNMPDGTSLETLGRVLDSNPHVEALGFNCIRREAAEPALRRLSAVTDKPLVIYPNSGETYDPATKTWHSPDAHAPDWGHFLPLWQQAGARCIGGCCRTLPKDIVEIAQLLGAAR